MKLKVTFTSLVIAFVFLMTLVTPLGLFAQRPATQKPSNPAPVKLSQNLLKKQENTTNTASSPVEAHLARLQQTGVMSDTDTAYFITSEHTSSLSGIHHIYYRQAINGIEVLGTEASLHILGNGEIFKSNDRSLLKGITSQVKSSSNAFTASQAIQSIASRMNYGATSNLKENATKLPSGYHIFTDRSISSGDILAKQAYLLQENAGITLVWEIIFPEKESSAAWNYRINAATGEIIEKVDLTVSCNILGEHNHDSHSTNETITIAAEECDDSLLFTTGNKTTAAPSEAAVMTGSYNVYALPIENPFYGNRSIVTNPADETASPFGWHDTNGVTGAEFTITRGNNTYTYEDIANNNDLPGDTNPSTDISGDSPDGGVSLNFNYAFDLTIADALSGFTVPRFQTTNRSQDAAATNIFYWTNIIHDVSYQYGFDEVSGNFQENNYGNGGSGNDSVNGESQDGGSTCNANMFTPVDGTNARMQMYICDIANPGYDGAYDNLVIVHEYAHGISTRLTGGAGNSFSLNNAEQMGEGWSDYYGYMLTMTADNFDQDRRVGTFLLGGTFLGGINGTGIRDAAYTADGNVNGNNQFVHTSLNILPGNTTPNPNNIPHSWGQVWATFLYDLTQALMDQYGFDPDFYNGTGGNNISLALVTEALKLQPASPGFVDGRDAILAADQAINGGANECLIWEVFANRGLGFSAVQGSSNSRTDNTDAFDVPPITLNLSETDLCLANGAISLNGGVVSGGFYSGPGVTDNGDGRTFTFDPVTAGTGVHIITYQATDCNGSPGNDTDTITVTEILPELSSCQDTTIFLGPDGTVTYNPLTPSEVTVVGGNNNSNTTGFSVIAVEITEDVTITFDWSFITTDTPGFDNGGYIIDTTFFPLTDNSATTQNGSQTLSLTAGQVFGFATITNNNTSGAATTSFTNFSPGYNGQFAAFNWEEILQNSDGSTTFSGASTSLTSSCGDTNVILSKEVFTCLDAGSTIPVTITAIDSLGNMDTCTVNVTIDGGSLGTSTFAAGSWDNIPTATSIARIQDDYDTENDGNINACSCTIESNNIVTVRDGDFLNVAGNITVESNGLLIVENSGSVVQIDNNAITTNNGTIEVRKTTPLLAPRDFIVLSSPMTLETKDEVYQNTNRVYQIVTSLFTPHPDVTTSLNFIDVDFDYFAPVTNLPAGQGFLVFPQAINDTGSMIFDHTYTLGTLNSGTITYPLEFNGPSTENNFNLVGNPYPSAIDSDVIISTNEAVNEIYYWEHLTPPTADNPGDNSENFSMDDISIYNLTGGIAAVNGGTVPGRFMASGQGFGILADQDSVGSELTFTNAMRLTGNNGTVRSQVITPNKIWLKISDEEEVLNNTTLIGFLEQATPLFDKGYDSPRLDTKLSLFTSIEGGKELSIQGREVFDSGARVNLGFATSIEETHSYTISIDAIEGLDLGNSPVYLKDNLTGETVNLKEENYNFTSSNASQADRFTIFFERASLSTDDSITTNSDLTIYPNPSQGLMTLSYRGDEKFNRAIIMDLNGKRIVEIDLSNFNKSLDIDLSRFSKGLYFMQISTANTLITKKVLLK